MLRLHGLIERGIFSPGLAKCPNPIRLPHKGTFLKIGNSPHPCIRFPTTTAIRIPGSNIQHPTSNIQYPTSNIQYPTRLHSVTTGRHQSKSVRQKKISPAQRRGLQVIHFIHIRTVFLFGAHCLLQTNKMRRLFPEGILFQ